VRDKSKERDIDKNRAKESNKEDSKSETDSKSGEKRDHKGDDGENEKEDSEDEKPKKPLWMSLVKGMHADRVEDTKPAAAGPTVYMCMCAYALVYVPVNVFVCVYETHAYMDAYVQIITCNVCFLVVVIA
jgi:hypothetical protein